VDPLHIVVAQASFPIRCRPSNQFATRRSAAENDLLLPAILDPFAAHSAVTRLPSGEAVRRERVWLVVSARRRNSSR